MDSIAHRGLGAWHAVVDAPTEAALDALLADDVVFHSPIVHTPQRGRALAKLYLMAAFQVLAGGGATATSATATPDRKFRYVREIVGDREAVLEFTTESDGITINGVDMIRWNDDGQIVDFKVMLRPLKAIQSVHAQMGRLLEVMKPAART